MKRIASTLALVAVVAGSALPAVAQETLGEKVASGKMSQAAFTQLIFHSGLTADEAASKTVNEVVRLRVTAD